MATYTQFNKSIVAAVASVVAAANYFVPAAWHFGVDPNIVMAVLTVLTPLLVHYIPNIHPDPVDPVEDEVKLHHHED